MTILRNTYLAGKLEYIINEIKGVIEMMFIYFWEQVWSNENDILNFETEEISRCYCDQYHLANRGKYYPTENMVEGVDWLDY